MLTHNTLTPAPPQANGQNGFCERLGTACGRSRNPDPGVRERLPCCRPGSAAAGRTVAGRLLKGCSLAVQGPASRHRLSPPAMGWNVPYGRLAQAVTGSVQSLKSVYHRSHRLWHSHGWLCALGNQACRQGYPSATCGCTAVRASADRHGEAATPADDAAVEKPILLDSWMTWGMQKVNAQQRPVLMEGSRTVMA